MANTLEDYIIHHLYKNRSAAELQRFMKVFINSNYPLLGSCNFELIQVSEA